MPSAFVRRANPKFGVEKEEGARKGVNFREDKSQETRKDGMFYLPFDTQTIIRVERILVLYMYLEHIRLLVDERSSFLYPCGPRLEVML